MMSRKYRADCGVPCRSSTAGMDDSPEVMKDNSVPLERRTRCRFGASISGFSPRAIIARSVLSEAVAPAGAPRARHVSAHVPRSAYERLATFGEPLAFA